ncbi:hypothetical protein ACTU3I_03355 [Microbacterium sp. RD1]|uniref:hypothetical protein n=1 Tax=Microbacterium sp. RD1 TaxID=3457313 RepID=UPI003FA54162
MPSAIDPSAIPGKDIDPDAIATNAGTVSTIATQVRDHGAAVHRKWQGMAAVYVAPESGTVLDLMSPVNSQATLVGDNLTTVSSALADFAEAVRPIKTALDQLRLDAEAFRAEIAGGVSVREVNPAWQSAQYSGSWNAYGATTDSDVEQYRTVTKEWHEVQEYVDRNNDLIRDVNAQQVLLWEAERDCANKIRALYGADPLRSAQSEDDPLAYGLDEIPEGTEMPWGAEVERTEGCGEATANFVFKDFLWEGIVVNGIWGTVEGLGTLVLGYNPETGGFFDGEVWGGAWTGLGMIVAAGAMNTGVLAPLFQADSMMEQFGGGGFLPQEVRDFKAQADETAINAGKALIAWDKWQDDPGTALGESVFNIGTALIPGGAAIAGVKTAGTAASVLSKIARFTDMVDPASWALNGTLKLGGAALGSLDNLIGKLDIKPADVNLGHPEVYTAMDVDSALRALDEWGVNTNDVYARVDANGTSVLEFPGGVIELPDGAFNGGIRAGDGGADAGVTAPVREPELVNAGGVRGETGAGAVDSLVDDAPVRTETGGTGGDSAVIRDPETTTGGTGDGNATGGHGGSGATHGDAGDGGPSGDGDGGSGAADATDASSAPGDSGAGSTGDGDGPTGGASAAEGNGAGDDGWTSSEGADLSLSPEQKAAVDEYLDGSRAAESRITADIQSVQSAHPGARLEGLEYRLKGDESMYRKVATELDQMAPGAPAGPVVSGMKDSIRYTFVVADDAYASGVNGIIRDLTERGYEPTGALKNTWGSDGYQGINSNWVDPQSGRIIEVQFHTDSSLAAKMEAHGLYEQSRLPGLDGETVARLEAEQSEIFGRVDQPDGAADIDWPGDAQTGGAADTPLTDPAPHDTSPAPAGAGVDDQAFFTDALADHHWSAAEANEVRRTPLEDLDDLQAEAIRDLRDAVPPVTPDTAMSKVIPVGDIEKYISGEYSQLGGFMTRAADYDGGTRALADVVEELRLDYADSPFVRPDADSFAVIDFQAGDGATFDVPYAPRLGGSHDWPPPFTGNGFTAAPGDIMVPEFVASHRFTPPEGALISVVDNGVKTPVAVFSNGEFHRIGGAQ